MPSHLFFWERTQDRKDRNHVQGMAAYRVRLLINRERRKQAPKVRQSKAASVGGLLLSRR